MSYTELLGRTFRENILFSVLLELTYRCNLDCFFCYNDLSLKGRPLSRERCLRLLEELAELNVLHLALSGGEPLAHPDFFLLGRRARQLGFAIRVKSNGHALHGALAKRLKEEVDPFVVEVSLHGARVETHERQTRVKGSFARLMESLETLRRLSLRVRLNSTLTAWNEGEIEEMYALAARLGLPLTFDPEVTPKDDGDQSPLAIAASRRGLLSLYRVQRRLAVEAGGPGDAPPLGRPLEAELPAPPAKHCGAGSSSLTIDPYGNVYPCVQWRVPAGNLNERSLREIWTGSPVLTRVRETTASVGQSLAPYGQENVAAMSFCPGMAQRAAGLPTLVYPAALARLEIRREAETPSTEA